MNLQKFETWLPLFPGFYGTYFELDESNFLYNENLDRSHQNLPEINYENLEVDYEGYQNKVAELCTDFVEGILIELKLVKKINFQLISSPKYYNFSNDSVNIEVLMNKSNIKNLQKYLKTNSENFQKYIKDNYTSRSGFISYHSNSSIEWSEETNNFTEFNDKHKLGAILQFVIENEQCDKHEDSSAYMQMFYFVNDHVSEYEFITIKDTEGVILIKEFAGVNLLPSNINFLGAGNLQAINDKNIFNQIYNATDKDDIDVIEWDNDINAGEFIKTVLEIYHNFILTPEESDNNLKLNFNTSERV